MSLTASATVYSVLSRPIVFIGGKGGVGKTTLSQAVALSHSLKKKNTLWVTFEDPTRPPGDYVQKNDHLWSLNCEPSLAFEEYVGILLKVKSITRIFVRNKLIQFLAQAAPGIHEMVLLGKVWYERTHYDHIVVDMPSTGFGLAMFQSTKNFSKLFGSGPLSQDAKKMLETFEDSSQTGHLIASLPEEMALTESLELDEMLLNIFPRNSSAFLVNKRFPNVEPLSTAPPEWPSPLAKNAKDYALKRNTLEKYNLRIWNELKIPYGQIDYFPPADHETDQDLSSVSIQVKNLLEEKGYV